MFILDDFTNTWNYTFIILAIISLTIGTILTIRKMEKEELGKRREKRNDKDK